MSDDAFQQAWSLMKDIDYDVATKVFTGRDNFVPSYNMSDYKQMLMDVMEDSTNLPKDPIARTPKLFRSMNENELDNIKIGDRHPKRYFSPQKITAQQYSQFFNRKDRNRKRKIGEFEMPVPLDHESVFRFFDDDTFRAFPEEEGVSDEQKERLAEGSNISIEEALERLGYADTAYMSSPSFQLGTERQNKFNEMMRNAGYDYVRHNEVASSILNPPVFSRFTEKMPRRDHHLTNEKLRDLNRNIQQRFGKNYPYKSVWHVGDEESAPVLEDVGEEHGGGDTDTDALLHLLFSGSIDDIYDGIYNFEDR